MWTRRQLLGWVPVCLLGCRRDSSGSANSSASAGASAGASASTSASASTRRSTREGVEILEIFPGGGDEKGALIVAIHGRGDRPENWVEDWSRFPQKAQIVLPRAFERFGSGYSWFDLHEGMSDAALGAGVGAAEARLWRAIAQVAAGRRVIVTGFSQGGILSYAMAARHPDEVIAAFPVAGALPGPLLPKDKARAAPVVGFHGTADDVIPAKWARETVTAFKAEGNRAELHEYEGVGHTVTRQIRADWLAAIQRAMA